MDRHVWIERLLASRADLEPAPNLNLAAHNAEAEGGCGVIGIACSEQIAARHMLQALEQMRNRGNGKGGGIAAVGLVPEEFGVSADVLANDYLLAVAYLDPGCRQQVERQHIHPTFEVDHLRQAPQLDDHTALPGLEVRPPEVYQYFVRPRPEAVEAFAVAQHLEDTPRRQVEDELVYQNSYRLNRAWYAATGEKQAFVLSHGKNMLALKMVGYGDDVFRYYRLEDMHAHVWIGHHRYPTKGRVWHPGGAHPFVGVNEALVHNGDFANYASIREYLAQRHIHPLFLTDTEVSVLVFDLLHRVYGYPLEYIIEALAPTTERDFALLPPEKQRVYELLQRAHMHCSPDGPWFFLIAQSEQVQPGSPDDGRLPANAADEGYPCYRLIGITDTSMLRPQVFAWQQVADNGPAIGFAASEKQAIDAALHSLALEDPRFWSRPDRLWNARGGSHTDGGAFLFSVYPDGKGSAELVCSDKFGRRIASDIHRPPFSRANGAMPANGRPAQSQGAHLGAWFTSQAGVPDLFAQVTTALPGWDYDAVLAFLQALLENARHDVGQGRAIELLAWLIDRPYATGALRRSSLNALFDRTFAALLAQMQTDPTPGFAFASVAGEPVQVSPGTTLVIDARGFPPEGPGSLARALVRQVERGFRRILVAHTRGQRFIANGLGADNQDVRIDVFGSPGDYLASGIDGAEVHVHAAAQDQVAQIMKSGKLVIHGDVGQTFMYAAKGGEAYVLGNAAGRPLINAVGKPRVVINGTCLDYLAESFMAGDPLNGGGFVILNGITFDDEGQIVALETPYPGGNLFSLASGGAIYIRDPQRRVSPEQLNGGEFYELSPADWALIRPYLEENERLFGIPLARLLQVEGEARPPEKVYRKIQPRAVRALQAEEAWVQRH